MIVTCEEKSGQAKAFEAVNVGPYDTLFFPNVDSCLSITYVLEGNYLVGGHAGYGADMNPNANGARVKGKMDQFVTAAGRTISMVVFIGDWQNYNIGQLIPAGVAQQHVHKIQTPGQSNIWFYSSRRWLSIERKGTQLHGGSIDLLPPRMDL
jgi:hypothetical protein